MPGGPLPGYLFPTYNFTLLGPEYLYENPGIGVTYLVLMVAFIVLGTGGNTLIICAVIVHKNLRTMGNMFIVNLAVADLCITSFVDPFAIVGFVMGEVYFLHRKALCITIASVCLTSCLCSLLTIAAISVNRYVHICQHIFYDAAYTGRKTFVMVVGLWTGSFLLGVSCYIGWGDHVYDRKTMSCLYDRTADYSFTTFLCVIGVSLPLVVIILCYIAIYRYLWRSQRQGIMNSSEHRPKAADRRLVKTILLIICIYVACWLPYVSVILYDKNDELPPTVHTFTVMSAHMSSSLNFVVYGLTNRNFNQAYRQLLQMVKIKRTHRRISGNGEEGCNLTVYNINQSLSANVEQRSEYTDYRQRDIYCSILHGVQLSSVNPRK